MFYMIKGYITNLGKYNEGQLIGEWITFPIDDEELEAVYERIGLNDWYEEIFFTDWDCEFDMGFGEYESIERINELAEALERADLDTVQAVIEATGYALDEAIEAADDAEFYRHMTLEDVACEIVEECYQLPDIAFRYFDYEAFARDLHLDGYEEVSNGVVRVH